MLIEKGSGSETEVKVSGKFGRAPRPTHPPGAVGSADGDWKGL